MTFPPKQQSRHLMKHPPEQSTTAPARVQIFAMGNNLTGRGIARLFFFFLPASQALYQNPKGWYLPTANHRTSFLSKSWCGGLAIKTRIFLTNEKFPYPFLVSSSAITLILLFQVSFLGLPHTCLPSAFNLHVAKKFWNCGPPRVVVFLYTETNNHHAGTVSIHRVAG